MDAIAEPLDLARLTALGQAAQDFVEASKAPNTLRAYRSDWRHFVAWCSSHGLAPLPAGSDTVALYLAAMAHGGAGAVTIQRRLSSISQAHQAAGHVPSPTQDFLVRQVMRGIRRTLGVAPKHQKMPLAAAELRRLVETTPGGTLAGLRDRALLLVGHLGAFRRSELVALDVEDVEETSGGLRLRVRRSKTDQEGEGLHKGIPRRRDRTICPVLALGAWLDAADIATGPVFRAVNRHDQVAVVRLSDRAVALVVKRSCERAGLDPAQYAGHSLRSGFATAAAEGGAPERAIMRQGGWTSETMVRRYIRMAQLFQENAAEYVDL
ncbi:MAG TPA: site-specific integrase [Candidatus Dormibacteraeota bacterium]